MMGPPKSIVVTGAAGFIGSHLCEALLAAGHEVTGVDCFTDYYSQEEKERNLSVASRDPRFRFVRADLRDADLHPIVDGADVVINEAATPGLVLSWNDFDRYQSTNLTAVQRLAEACIEVGVGRFVQASTSSVYGVEATGPEDSALRPVSPYGVTKVAAEHLLYAHSEASGLPVTVLRYFSIYGPRQRPDMAYRIFCERLLAGDPITVFGDGGQSRSNTFVSDCVDATVLAAFDPRAVGSTFNVGGGRELTLLDAISILAQHLGVQPVIAHRDVRRGDQRRTVADIGHIGRTLGWHPRVEPEEGLLREVEWVAAHRS